MNDKIMYEIIIILNWGCEIIIYKLTDPHSYECNFCNCVWNP